nr:hypothetical protein [Micromonospora endophytica]
MGRHGARLRWVVALVSVTVAVLATVDHARQREREQHGSPDAVTVTVEAMLPAAHQVADLAAAYGWRNGATVDGDPDNQSVLLRLRWSGPELPGNYQVMLLDKRLTPPRVVPPFDGWDAVGGTGFNWADSYEQLADRYDWLAGAASRPESSDSLRTPDNLGAVGTRAVADGSLVALFRMGTGAAPLTDPADLLVAFCHVDETGAPAGPNPSRSPDPPDRRAGHHAPGPGETRRSVRYQPIRRDSAARSTIGPSAGRRATGRTRSWSPGARPRPRRTAPSPSLARTPRTARTWHVDRCDWRPGSNGTAAVRVARGR